VRRETAGGYLRSAGIALRRPGWAGKAPAKAATAVTTGVDSSEPAIEVITGFLPEVRLPEQRGKSPSGASEAYRELIEFELSRGRNAMGTWQDLVDTHGFTGCYQNVKRPVRKLPLTAAEELLEIIMRRYERASTLLTSNRPVDDWGKLLGDSAAVTVTLDRLLHDGHVLKCGPRSWPTKTGNAGDAQ
jgi:hypothetical protein